MTNRSKAIIDWLSKLYCKYLFKSTSLNVWKMEKITTGDKIIAKKLGSPKIPSNKLLHKTIGIINTPRADTVIS